MALIFAAALWSGPALAQQCAATGTNQTCTNSILLSGATGLTDNATVTVTNTSTGTIAGTAGDGIFAHNDANVTNFGLITAAGVGNSGIHALGNAHVTNFNTIAGETDGIFLKSGNAVATNFGTITGGVTGILVFGNADVSNSGTIFGGLSAIQAFGANINNSGIITGGITGLRTLSAAANVVNSGIITGGTYGIQALATANVSNSGLITGGIYGIFSAGAANLTNAGTIIGNGAAIQFSTAADTLTILPGSKIVGALNIDGGGDTVNIRAGNQNLTFDTLAGATVTSTVPFVVSGNQVVTVDPTPFAANGRALNDFSRGVSQVIPDFGNLPAASGGAPTAFAAPDAPGSIFSPAFDNIPGLSAYAADQAVFKAPTVVRADGTAIWARGFGGYRVQRGDDLLQRTSSMFYGGAIGVERQVRPDLRVGVFAGAGTTRSTIDLNSGNTDSNLGFGGLYARYFQGASFLYTAVQGGGSHNGVARNINNNLAAGGLESAKGSYSGWYVSPELKLGTNVALGRVMDSSYTLTPSIGVRYLYGSFGGYTETGSTANLTVNSQTAQMVEERAELKLTRVTAFDAKTALLLDITGGALGIQRVGSNIVNAALLGQSIPFATPGKDDVWGGFGGLGMEWRTNNVSIFASGEYLWLSDSSTVISSKGGVRVSF